MRILLCTLVAVGCTPPETLATDAGTVPDAASMRPDAAVDDRGAAFDAGTAHDVGGRRDGGMGADGGVADAASATDAGASPDAGLPNDCDSLIGPLMGALREARRCSVDDECGQPISGTSCGCTRDLVARLDADLSWFRALKRRGELLGCDLPFMSTCDCPAADGFRCEEGVCNWNYLR